MTTQLPTFKAGYPNSATRAVLVGKQFLLLDRDKKYGEGFPKLLTDAGTEMVRLPVRSPNLNAYAQRFVLSIKRESFWEENLEESIIQPR
ncbi:hypothetical protein MYX78_00315 [Acidobacteria bacterium AH-259-G07]|nr:hypothetical protein [Acidobacteria bacterium AH-259-G07]